MVTITGPVVLTVNNSIQMERTYAFTAGVAMTITGGDIPMEGSLELYYQVNGGVWVELANTPQLIEGYWVVDTGMIRVVYVHPTSEPVTIAFKGGMYYVGGQNEATTSRSYNAKTLEEKIVEVSPTCVTLTSADHEYRGPYIISGTTQALNVAGVVASGYLKFSKAYSVPYRGRNFVYAIYDHVDGASTPNIISAGRYVSIWYKHPLSPLGNITRMWIGRGATADILTADTDTEIGFLHGVKVPKDISEDFMFVNFSLENVSDTIVMVDHETDLDRGRIISTIYGSIGTVLPMGIYLPIATSWFVVQSADMWTGINLVVANAERYWLPEEGENISYPYYVEWGTSEIVSWDDLTDQSRVNCYFGPLEDEITVNINDVNVTFLRSEGILIGLDVYQYTITTIKCKGVPLFE